MNNMLTFKQFIIEQVDFDESRDEEGIKHRFNVGPHTVEVQHAIYRDKQGRVFVDTDFEVNGKTLKDPSQQIEGKHVMKIFSGVSQSIKRIKATEKKKGKPIKFSFYGNTDEKEEFYKKATKRLAGEMGGKSSFRGGQSHITIKEESINLSPEEEEQIIRKYHEGIKNQKENGERFNIHKFSDEIGMNHQTIRRKLLTRRKFNEITERIKSKDPNFEPQELRFGPGNKDGSPHFASPQMYRSLKKAHDAQELSIAEIKKMYPGVGSKTVKLRLGIKDVK